MNKSAKKYHNLPICNTILIDKANSIFYDMMDFKRELILNVKNKHFKITVQIFAYEFLCSKR